MAPNREVKQVLKLVSLCTAWYLSSSTGNVVAKTLLADFPYPVTLTMVQHICLIVFLPPLLRCWDVKDIATSSAATVPIDTQYYLWVLVPISAGKFLSNASAAFSIWKVPLSYAHTVKATMPLWTVLLSRIILKETQTTKVYLSLMPIIFGVLIATVTEISFDSMGLVYALCATIGFSLQNIFTKRTMKETGIHHLKLLLIVARISAALFFPFWLFTDILGIWNSNTQTVHGKSVTRSVTLLVLDGFLNFAQNLAAFSILSLVTPLSYAVANATKRITVITFSIIMMQNPVTPMNAVGMGMAILGVFCYNKTKYDQSQQAKIMQSLPMTKSDVDLRTFNNFHIPRKIEGQIMPENGIQNGSVVHHNSRGRPIYHL